MKNKILKIKSGSFFNVFPPSQSPPAGVGGGWMGGVVVSFKNKTLKA